MRLFTFLLIFIVFSGISSSALDSDDSSAANALSPTKQHSSKSPRLATSNGTGRGRSKGSKGSVPSKDNSDDDDDSAFSNGKGRKDDDDSTFSKGKGRKGKGKGKGRKGKGKGKSRTDDDVDDDGNGYTSLSFNSQKDAAHLPTVTLILSLVFL